MRLPSRGHAIMLLAFALRVFHLNERGVWYDEAFAILYASRSFGEMIAGTLTQVSGVAADVHPLFYYFALHLWMQVAGDSAFAARFFSVFFGVATVALAFHIARDLFGRRTGSAAALVLAIAPYHLAYSQEARMYAMLAFWSTLALFAFIRFRRTFRKSWWALFVVVGAGALYSHNLAFLSFAALGIWTIADALRTRTIHLLRATVLAGAAMVLLWLPWLILVPSQFGKIEQAYWVPPPTVVSLVQTLLVFTFDFDNAAAPAVLVPFLLFAAILMLTLISLELARRRRERAAELTLAVALAFLPIILLFTISQWRPVYIIRALLPAFVWYGVLAGWMLVRAPRPIKYGAAICMSALTLAVLPAYYDYATFPRSPFKETAVTLQPRLRSGDVILHDNKLSFFPMYYYDRTLPEMFLADPPSAGSDTLAAPTQQALQLYATDFEAATAKASRVWFVIFQRALDESAGPHPNLMWMEQHWRRASLERFNDLNVYLFEK